MEAETTVYAIAIVNEDGGSGVSGIVKFSQKGSEKTRITATIKGLATGLHGFHVHQFGNLTEGCKTAGPHFNPAGVVHGGPSSEIRHHGDLGNIESKGDDETTYDYEDHVIQLSGEHSIIGRSVVVHADIDDLGVGGHELSSTTGNAGARLGCGTIGLSNTFEH